MLEPSKKLEILNELMLDKNFGFLKNLNNDISNLKITLDKQKINNYYFTTFINNKKNELSENDLNQYKNVLNLINDNINYINMLTRQFNMLQNSIIKFVYNNNSDSLDLDLNEFKLSSIKFNVKEYTKLHKTLLKSININESKIDKVMLHIKSNLFSENLISLSQNQSINEIIPDTYVSSIEDTKKEIKNTKINNSKSTISDDYIKQIIKNKSINNVISDTSVSEIENVKPEIKNTKINNPTPSISDDYINQIIKNKSIRPSININININNNDANDVIKPNVSKNIDSNTNTYSYSIPANIIEGKYNSTLNNLEKPTLKDNSNLENSRETYTNKTDFDYINNLNTKVSSHINNYLSKKDSILNSSSTNNTLDSLNKFNYDLHENNSKNQETTQSNNVDIESNINIDKNKLNSKDINLNINLENLDLNKFNTSPLDEIPTEKNLILDAISNQNNDITNKIKENQNEKNNKENINIDQDFPFKPKKEKTTYTKLKDNKNLIISEKDHYIYLPYTTHEIYGYIKSYPKIYKNAKSVIEKEFILPYEEFEKHPTKARFHEAYNLMRDREMCSTIESLKFAFDIMFDYKLHPAIIAACKSLNQLADYLDCLDKNDLKNFKHFNIIFKVAPVKSSK